MLQNLSTNRSPETFWISINILLTKPHVINKRLWGCKLWKRSKCKPEAFNWKAPLFMKRLELTISSENAEKCITELQKEAKLVLCDAEENVSIIEIMLIELLPKSVSDYQAVQLIVVDQQNTSVTFYDVTQKGYKQNLFPDFTYTFQLKANEVLLIADSETYSASYLWLKNTLLPQIVKWMEETSNTSHRNNICKESLALVSQQKYYSKYNELKLRYGKEMVKIWPECTDPSKFVYEDVAIATYLLLLWEDKERPQTKKHTFVDLGCGNGLLVYILTMEGYSGVGIDVRKRNIWDMYSSEVTLQEKTIVPSDSSLFPDTDWIIGNHSDELTPWIPVIAAKSSYECNFFLLPCCAYNFDGTKYQRKDSSKSQYKDYLAHIQELSKDCGFNVDVDRLKIPSTKRICLVSKGRTYSRQRYEEYSRKIQEIIDRDSGPIENEINQSWVKDFKPREAVERVRNCTQIDKDLISSIVKCIANHLLEGSGDESIWYAGKTVEFSEIIQLIPQHQLKQLKSECGGIQTLLKNNHNIFQVQSGKVQLRYPKSIEEVTRKNKISDIKIKQKPCWFFSNHPQGCPLSDTTCSFLHVKS